MSHVQEAALSYPPPGEISGVALIPFTQAVMEPTNFLRLAPFVIYGRDTSRPGDRLLPSSVYLPPLRPARNPREQFEHPWPLRERY